MLVSDWQKVNTVWGTGYVLCLMEDLVDNSTVCFLLLENDLCILSWASFLDEVWPPSQLW